MVHTEKQQLRSDLLARRYQLSQTYVQSASFAIIRKLIDVVKWRDGLAVHVYQPMLEKNEVDTRPLLKYLRSVQQNVALYVASQDDRQPPGIQFDVVIVPMLGFDRARNRLGYGMGYYDKFLAQQKAAVSYGLCFAACEIGQGVPREPHDMRPDYIITEAQVIGS